MFGHEKGAFTGAAQQRVGRFEQADGGTLFLDEIGDMPPDTQTRLLRVLADGEFYRVGGHSPVRVDVRIIAATHQNLERLVEQGSFREDLFHRLNVIRIHLPRLTERREDIPLLARHFLKAAAAELGGETKVLRPETEQYLAGLPWPGNVRQLENTCRWLTVMASGREVYVDDLPPELRAIESAGTSTSDWETALGRWAHEELARIQPGNGIAAARYRDPALRTHRHRSGARAQRRTPARRLRSARLGAQYADAQDEGTGHEVGRRIAGWQYFREHLAFMNGRTLPVDHCADVLACARGRACWRIDL